MADILFCLDIHEDSLVAVVVDRNSRVSVVMGCGVAEFAEQSFEDALVQLKEQAGFTEEPCLVTFGAELFSFRNLSLPFSDIKKINQVLSFELMDLTPVDVDSLAVDSLVVTVGSQEANIVAAMIDREYLTNRLSSLTNAGFDPDIAGISGVHAALQITGDTSEHFVMIDIEENRANLYIVASGHVVLIRSIVSLLGNGSSPSSVAGFVLTVKQTLLASKILNMTDPDYLVYLTGSEPLQKVVAESISTELGGVEVQVYQQSTQPRIKIDPDVQSSYKPELMDKVLALGLKGVKRDREFNFRKGVLKKSKSSLEYRKLIYRFAVPVGIFIASVIAYLGFGYSGMSASRNQIDQEIISVFKETFPEVKRIVNPVQQLQVVNNEIRETYRPGGDNGTGHTVIELLTELSTRIPASYEVKIIRLVADKDTIRVKAVTGDFNTVDNIQKEVAKSQYFDDVTISSANQSSKGDGVGFELKLQLAGQ